MTLFEMMTNKWLSCWRLAKYLKKFTDVQLFPYLLSIQRGLNRMLGFFLAMGVGRNMTIGGMVDWGLIDEDRWSKRRKVGGRKGCGKVNVAKDVLWSYFNLSTNV